MVELSADRATNAPFTLSAICDRTAAGAGKFGALPSPEPRSVAPQSGALLQTRQHYDAVG